MCQASATERLAAPVGRRTVDHCAFIAGASDWGVYQSPGALDRMAKTGCADFRGTTLIEGAGHWVQQEQAEAVVERVAGFLEGIGERAS